jgi:pimeloyl-ACP methyl ester carboxylesterase
MGKDYRTPSAHLLQTDPDMSALEDISVTPRNELPIPQGLAFADAGHGPPIVLLHAFPLDGEMWAAQVERWRDRWRVVVPDLRGFGASPSTSGDGLAMADYADDVIRLLDTLSIDRACVGGLSMGGYVALALAERHPERLSGLVLANTRAGADNEAGRAKRAELAKKVEESGSEALADALLDKLLGASASAETVALVKEVVVRQDPAGALSAIRGMASRRDRSDILPSIRVPTLVIGSTEDRLIPIEEERALSRAIPGAFWAEIGGAGHLSNLEQPELFARAFEEHLDRLDRS